MRLHIDTDLGGDPDDACALAMILGWPDVDVVGVTTNLDIGGRRAGCATHVLRLARRDDVPVAAGAAASPTTSRQFPSTWSDCRYWPDAVDALPSPSGAAVDLLADSIAKGATVVAVGADTNLALLAVTRPAILDGVPVVAMGGWIDPPVAGLPQWGPEIGLQRRVRHPRRTDPAGGRRGPDAGHAAGDHAGGSCVPRARWEHFSPGRPWRTPKTMTWRPSPARMMGWPTTCSTSTTTRSPARSRSDGPGVAVEPMPLRILFAVTSAARRA